MSASLAFQLAARICYSLLLKPTLSQTVTSPDLQDVDCRDRRSRNCDHTDQLDYERQLAHSCVKSLPCSTKVGRRNVILSDRICKLQLVENNYGKNSR